MHQNPQGGWFNPDLRSLFFSRFTDFLLPPPQKMVGGLATINCVKVCNCVSVMETTFPSKISTVYPVCFGHNAKQVATGLTDPN